MDYDVFKDEDDSHVVNMKQDLICFRIELALSLDYDVFKDEDDSHVVNMNPRLDML